MLTDAPSARPVAPGMKVLYFAPSDLMVPRVDRQSIMKFCSALGELCAVELVSLRTRLRFSEPTSTRDIWAVYGVEPTFTLTIVPTLLTQLSSGWLIGVQRFLVYALYLVSYAFRSRLFRRDSITVIYFKNYLLTIPFVLARAVSRRRVQLLFEIHAPPSKVGLFFLKRVDGIICVSRRMGDELVGERRLPPDNILVAHHGVDLAQIESRRMSKTEARELLGLDKGQKLVVYTGKVVNESREVPLLLEAARHLTEDVTMIILGGREDAVARYRQEVSARGLENVVFPGFVAPADVLPYQLAADALVTYYPSDLPLNEYRSSPGKLFEYMSTGNPIVSANYPALQEVLPPDAAVYVEPDAPPALAEAIQGVLDDPNGSAAMAKRAHEAVRDFTWSNRADRIVAFILRVAGDKVSVPGS